MSQDSSSTPKVCSGLSFQGLQISVKGPSSKALAFIRTSKISVNLPLLQAAARHHLPHPCPASVLVLAGKLSAAGILSPEERVKRAWSLGLSARKQIEEGISGDEPVVDIDLPNNHFAIVRSQVFGEGPKIIRSAAECKKILGTRCTPPPVGHGFPSNLRGSCQPRIH